MLFLVVCRDLPGSEALRPQLMPKHGPCIKPFLPNFAVDVCDFRPQIGSWTGKTSFN
jgi:hypothetical protein